jgi:hypothetical protein
LRVGITAIVVLAMTLTVLGCGGDDKGAEGSPVEQAFIAELDTPSEGLPDSLNEVSVDCHGATPDPEGPPITCQVTAQGRQAELTGEALLAAFDSEIRYKATLKGKNETREANGNFTLEPAE